MNPKLLHSSSIVVSLVATLTLFGCGGGGGGTATMTPDAASPVMTPDPASPVMMPEEAAPTLAELLENPDSQFTPVATGTRTIRTTDPRTVEPANDVRMTSVSGYGPDGFHVTYVQGGNEYAVHFMPRAANEADCDGCYSTETDDGGQFWFWSEQLQALDRSQSPRYRYADVSDAGFDPGQDESYRLFLVYGSPTEAADLPTGTAEYFGRMYSRSQLTDDPRNSGRLDFSGSVRITAKFDASTLNGRIYRIDVRRYDQDGTRGSWERLPESNYFALDNGQITDGQFTADLTGMDPDQNALDDSVRGFEGNVLGEFYGPAADELGAAIEAESQAHDRVLLGRFRARQLNPSVPEGDASLLSVAVERDYVGSTSQLTDSAEVTDIESDRAGGFYVTYGVDGVDHRVHLEASDYASDPRFNVYANEGRHSPYAFWYYTNSFFGFREFSYFNVYGWSVNKYADDDPTMGENAKSGFSVYGVPTETSDLPTGTASYAGRVWTEGWSTGSPERDDASVSRGSLELMANFGSGTIGGMLDNFEYRAPGQSSYVDIDSPVLIQNGAITNNEFTADLVGQRDAAGFEGDMTGQFFGPGAAEVGGVLTGTNTTLNTVVQGAFGGTKQ